MQAIKGVKAIHCWFLAKYQNLLPLQFGVYEGYPTLTFDNKLVTPRNMASYNTNSLSFGSLDPRRIIQKVLSKRGVYLQDNVVVYEGIGHQYVLIQLMHVFSYSL